MRDRERGGWPVVCRKLKIPNKQTKTSYILFPAILEKTLESQIPSLIKSHSIRSSTTNDTFL